MPKMEHILGSRYFSGLASAGLFRVAAATVTKGKTMTSKVEFRVRPVIRYVVTRYDEVTGNEENQDTSGSGPRGEFDNEVLARNAALAFADHETILAQPPDVVVIDNCTWTPGKGWSDESETAA